MQLFALLFEHKRAAFGAFFARGHIPNGKIAFRVVIAVVENTFVSAEAAHDLTAAFRAGNAYLFLDSLRVFAFREGEAGIEFAVSALADNNLAAAFGAFDVGFFGFFLLCRRGNTVFC